MYGMCVMIHVQKGWLLLATLQKGRVETPVHTTPAEKKQGYVAGISLENGRVETTSCDAYAPRRKERWYSLKSTCNASAVHCLLSSPGWWTSNSDASSLVMNRGSTSKPRVSVQSGVADRPTSLCKYRLAFLIFTTRSQRFHLLRLGVNFNGFPKPLLPRALSFLRISKSTLNGLRSGSDFAVSIFFNFR